MMMRLLRCLMPLYCCLFLILLCLPATALAQTQEAVNEAALATNASAQEVAEAEEPRRRQVQAMRRSTAVSVDGRLDEPAWLQAHHRRI